MTSPRIDFDGGIPKEIVSSLEKYILKYLWVLPPWSKRIYVFLGSDQKNPLEVMGERAYRRVQMYVSSSYMVMTEKQREEAVLHEVSHIVSEPIRSKYMALLDFILEKEFINENLYSKLADEYVEECEGMTQDMTMAISDFLEENGLDK